MNTAETRVWGEGRPKDRVSLQIILVFTLTHPKLFTGGHDMWQVASENHTIVLIDFKSISIMLK
jgi:hypothetical protein